MTTIEKINRATGQETQHPLICVVDSHENHPCPQCHIDQSDFYALTIKHDADGNHLHLSMPGEDFGEDMDNGVYFHPDLLFGTPLESHMPDYTGRCCHCNLTDSGEALINDCFGKIKCELNHPIDRHSATILSSHIELLLNYCVRICN